jgi:hypothetical protein
MTTKHTNGVSGGSTSSKEATLAGLLLVVLDDRRKMGTLLLVFFVMALSLFLGVLFILHHLPSNASEIQFGTAHIQFSQPGKNEKKYLVAVPPAGWVRTGIRVLEGDVLAIEADGKVYVDLGTLNEKINKRVEAEDRVTKKWTEEKINSEGLRPEDFFSTEGSTAINSLKPKWNWNGPNGIPEEDMKKLAMPARRERSILPKEGYGTLLGSLYETDGEPSDLSATATQHLVSNVFRVGSSLKMKADRDGYLYFVVNDVQGPPEFPDMFFIDNIGTFYAKITVTQK